MEALPHKHKDHHTISQPPINHTTHTRRSLSSASASQDMRSLRTFARTITRHCPSPASALNNHETTHNTHTQDNTQWQ